MKRFLACFGLAVAAALVLTGCSSSAANAPRVTITETELTIQPGSITFVKGINHVILKNTGVLPHDFHVDALGIKMGPVEPGRTIEADVKADKTGTFDAYCSQVGHKESGMVAKVIVQ